MTVFTNIVKGSVLALQKKGFVRQASKTIYEELRLTKGNVTLVLYTSGKLLLQGKPEEVKEVARQMEKMGMGEPAKAEKFRKEEGWVIGSDEVLKGDTFGGLVVAAVKADDQIREKLVSIGVADSKELSDREVMAMAEVIKKIAPCEIKSLLPEEYNKHDGNVTSLLDRLHQQAGKELSPGRHVVDKYPGCQAGEVQEEKAESKYVEVAAASVLARAAGLQQLNYLSSLAGFALPKGSTHVRLALHELKERGLDFRKFVKVGFRNVREFLEAGGS